MINKEDKKDDLIMIGSESETFKRVHKGNRIKTKDGYYIAGETPEENKRRWEQRKEIKKANKLDFKTWLYLYITQAKRVEHPIVENVDVKRTVETEDSKKYEVYVFRNYEEYKNYFLMYLDSVEDEVIDLAIYTRGSKGQVIALKGLCEQIIVKKNKIKINEQGPVKKLVPNNKK